MSRTIRRKNKTPKWVLEDWDYFWPSYIRITTQIDPSSKEGKLRLAKYHSDVGESFHNWRGPGWFHREYSQCPYRRECRDQIQKYLKEEIEDVVVLSKPKREYWD